jgi:hypothetical protein
MVRRTGENVLVQNACIEIDSEASGDDVDALLRLLTSGGPFEVSSVQTVGAGRHCCRFGLVRPDLAVGFRSVIELQHRIDREFNIVSVDHQSTHFSNKDLVPS